MTDQHLGLRPDSRGRKSRRIYSATRRPPEVPSSPTSSGRLAASVKRRWPPRSFSMESGGSEPRSVKFPCPRFRSSTRSRPTSRPAAGESRLAFSLPFPLRLKPVPCLPLPGRSLLDDEPGLKATRQGLQPWSPLFPLTASLGFLASLFSDPLLSFITFPPLRLTRGLALAPPLAASSPSDTLAFLRPSLTAFALGPCPSKCPLHLPTTLVP